MSSPEPYPVRIAALADPEARAEWETLHERSPQQSPFTDLRFAEALSLEHPGETFLLLAQDGGGPTAGLIVYEKRRGPFRAAALPALAHTNSIVLSKPLRDSDVHYRRAGIEALLDSIEENFHQTTLPLHHSIDDARPFTWRGWSIEPRYTYVVDLGKEDLLADWSSTHRNTFRRHRDAFEIGQGVDVLEEVVNQIMGAYERRGERFPITRVALMGIASRLVEAGLATPVSARSGGETVGGLLLLGDGPEVSYWLGGSDPGPVMTVMLGRLMEIAAARGAERLDLTGANVPSIAEFKRKFGATRRTYFRARLVTRAELRLLDALRPRPRF